MILSKPVVSLVFTSVAILTGYVFGSYRDVSQIIENPIYPVLVYTLLAIGLYGSVYSINKEELNSNRSIVLQAVTVGVLFKMLFIGVVVYLVTKSPISFLLGITVAQIDPLSVARLLTNGEDRLSRRARTILSAWSSFDDPVTVLASLYVAVSLVFIDPVRSIGQQSSTTAYFVDLGLNILLATAIYFLHRLIKRSTILEITLLIGAFIIAVGFQLMLGIALIGLFLRPDIKRALPFLVNVSYYVSLVILGALLIKGVRPIEGFVLGISAIVAQILAGIFLARNLQREDKYHLSFAQQNGITAIILALIFEYNFPGIVATVAPAILFINVSHSLLNRLIDKYLASTQIQGEQESI